MHHQEHHRMMHPSRDLPFRNPSLTQVGNKVAQLNVIVCASNDLQLILYTL